MLIQNSEMVVRIFERPSFFRFFHVHSLGFTPSQGVFLLNQSENNKS
jgi:hypothetical protein